MSIESKMLAIPEAARHDPYAQEMVRAWVADRQLHCVAKVGAWSRDGQHDEALAWGILLADIAKHLAAELEPIAGVGKRELLKRIQESFSVEMLRVSMQSGELSADVTPVSEPASEDSTHS